MNYWYCSRSNEIFLDLDSGRAITRALSVIRRILEKQGSYMNTLPIESVWLYRSRERYHAHMIIVLRQELPFFVRVAWSLWMGGDQIRAAYVLERYRWIQNQQSAELLVTSVSYGFRPPDDQCACVDKHKRKVVTDRCPALQRLLGDHRSDDYFPRNRDRKRRKPVRFKWGKISLKQIAKWRCE